MSTVLPTILLIHGVWHRPSHYQPLIDKLRSHGFEVHAPALPSMNEARPPNCTLETDSNLIRGYTESLVSAGREVVVLMHSYGEQVGTNSLVGLGKETRSQMSLQGGIAQLVYMCAYAMSVGGSVMGKVREFGHEQYLPLVIEFAEDRTCVHIQPKDVLLGPGISEEDADKYVAQLLRCNGNTLDEPTKNCAWLEMPVAYIFTTEDQVVPPEYQESCIKTMRDAGRAVEVHEIKTGHSLHVTAPDETVEIVRGIVSRLG